MTANIPSVDCQRALGSALHTGNDIRSRDETDDELEYALRFRRCENVREDGRMHQGRGKENAGTIFAKRNRRGGIAMRTTEYMGMRSQVHWRGGA